MKLVILILFTFQINLILTGPLLENSLIQKKVIYDTVKVKVYFNAFDEYHKTREFFVKILAPFYFNESPNKRITMMKNLKQTFSPNRNMSLLNIMEIELVPWGDAVVMIEEGSYVYSCDHEENECYATRIHACAIMLYRASTTEPWISSGPIQTNLFSICMFTRPNWENPTISGSDCANRVWPSDSWLDDRVWESIHECATSTSRSSSKFWKMFQEMREKTPLETMNYGGAPFVTIDGGHNEYAEDGELLEEVCHAYKGVNKPSECKYITPRTTTTSTTTTTTSTTTTTTFRPSLATTHSPPRDGPTLSTTKPKVISDPIKTSTDSNKITTHSVTKLTTTKASDSSPNSMKLAKFSTVVMCLIHGLITLI